MSNVATIISIAPCAFHEEKPSIIPKTYVIPRCDDVNKPSFLHIHDARTFEYIDEVRKNRNYPVSASELAESIVRDIRSSMFGKDNDTNAFPGIAAVPDKIDTVDELNKKYPKLLGELKTQQTNWYKYLVFLADDDWQKYKQHKMITSLSIVAAKNLGLEREWIINFDDTGKKCPACMSHVPTEAIVCKHCLTILNPEKYKMFQKASAG